MGVIHIGGWIQKGVRNCFSLVMYEFCSSSALYLASLSFIMSIYLLTHSIPKIVIILNQISENAYKQCSVTPFCPCVTKWTALKRPFKAIYEVYQQLLSALSLCLIKRCEPKVVYLILVHYWHMNFWQYRCFLQTSWIANWNKPHLIKLLPCHCIRTFMSSSSQMTDFFINLCLPSKMKSITILISSNFGWSSWFLKHENS